MNFEAVVQNEALFKSLLEEAGVEKEDVFDTKSFFTSFFFKSMQGGNIEDALRQGIKAAKDVMANPSTPRPPLVTRSYLNWRDQQRAERGLPPIANNEVPQRGAFPPPPAHLKWNQN